MWKMLITPAAAMAIGLAAGCDRPRSETTAAAVPPAFAALAQVSPQLVAAEPFEALTEMALSASRTDLEVAVLKAVAATDIVRPDLSADAAGQLTSRIAEIRAALAKDNRADLAIASVEAYRTLVSAAPRTRFPLEVSLLDYAGFRYQADLRATPARWADMGQAASFARGEWAALAPRISDAGLRSRFEQAVEALRIAQQQRDPARAELAARAELDLVDELETYFNTQQPSL